MSSPYPVMSMMPSSINGEGSPYPSMQHQRPPQHQPQPINSSHQQQGGPRSPIVPQAMSFPPQHVRPFPPSSPSPISQSGSRPGQPPQLQLGQFIPARSPNNINPSPHKEQQQQSRMNANPPSAGFSMNSLGAYASSSAGSPAASSSMMAPQPQGSGSSSPHSNSSPNPSLAGESLGNNGRSRKANPLEELIDSEGAYIHDLGLIIKNVASAWSRENPPPPILDSIFRAIEGVWKSNKAFYTRLRQIGENPSSPKALGDLLMRWVEDLTPAYTKYAQCYYPNLSSHSSISSNARIGDILSSLPPPSQPPQPSSPSSSSLQQPTPPATKWTINLLFSLPKDRLSYYRKLYGKLLKSTKEGRSDWKLLVGAVERLDGLEREVEERCRLDVNGNVNGGSSSIGGGRGSPSMNHQSNIDPTLGRQSMESYFSQNSGNESSNGLEGDVKRLVLERQARNVGQQQQQQQLGQENLGLGQGKGQENGQGINDRGSLASTATSSQDMTNILTPFSSRPNLDDFSRSSTVTSLNSVVDPSGFPSPPVPTSVYPNEKARPPPGGAQDPSPSTTQTVMTRPKNGEYAPEVSSPSLDGRTITPVERRVPPLTDLEIRLDTERTLDLFSMKFKSCRLQMKPNSLSFDRKLRSSADASIFFTPTSTRSEVAHPRAHIFILTDLFLMCELMTATEKVAKAQQILAANPSRAGDGGPLPEMWLLYPPLAGRHLTITYGNQDNEMIVEVMKKEKFEIVVESREVRETLMNHLKDCSKFAASVPKQKIPLPNQTSSQASSPLSPTGSRPPPHPPYPTVTHLDSSHGSGFGQDVVTRPPRNASLRSPAFNGPGSVPSQGYPLPSPASSSGQGYQQSVQSGSNRSSPIQHTNFDSTGGPSNAQYGQNQQHPSHLHPVQPGASMNLQPGQIVHTHSVPGSLGLGMNGGGGPGMAGAPLPRGASSSTGAAPLMNVGMNVGQVIPGRRMTNSDSGHGRQAMPNHAGPMHGPPPGQQYNPRQPSCGPSPSSSHGPTQGYTASPPMTGNGFDGYGVPVRANSAGPDGRGYHAAGPSSSHGHGAYVNGAGLGPGPGPGYGQPPQAQYHGSPQRQPYHPSDDDVSPPLSPIEDEAPRSTTQAVISAQMKCKIYLKQGHGQWKSLGGGKLKLYVQPGSNMKQLCVESDDKHSTMVISTMVLTSAVERVAKTGVAIEIGDAKGGKTGVVYMLQMRNEESAKGLFESLLAGSDRAR